MKCAICNSKEVAPVFKDTPESSEWILNGKLYNYQLCAECGFVQCSPVPSQEELLNFYQKEYAYEWFQSNSYFKRIQAKHRLHKINESLKGCVKLLDFGCGHGFFVEEAARKGINAHGFDIGVDKIINTRGYQIVNKNSFDEYLEAQFNIITAWHVIEHMRDVNQVISDLKGRLSDGGKLIIALPNLGSLGFRLFKQKWGWIQQPYVHMNHFNNKTLSMVLKKHGFKIISIQTSDTWDQNLYDLLITKFFYRNKSRNTVRKFGTSFKGKFIFKINQLVRLMFTPISYLYSGLQKSRNQGSELLIVAQR